MADALTILCIDDEALGLQIRRAVLEKAGFQVLTATDGPQGLLLFADHAVDAVLLDYLMPEMDGGTVARAIRAKKPQVPILLHSACVDVPPEVVGMVDSTLAKGEGPQVLISRLEQLIEASHIQTRE
jgi:CheY-like chemotaxis protein